MIFLDTETCGYHGPIVLLQYAYDEGEIILYEVWNQPVRKTLSIVEKFCDETIVGFNLAYDWFHLCQLYTTLRLLKTDLTPREQLTQYINKEQEARFGPCLKPRAAIDLMLVARKTKYQTLMKQKNIYIRRVPTAIAEELCKTLDERIPLDNIYFARKSDPTRHWQVDNTKDKQFKTVSLRWAASSALKALIAHITGKQTILYEDIRLPKNLQPNEVGYAPWAKALELHTWPNVIDAHIDMWQNNNVARTYAENDVYYTRILYHHLDEPESDIDSELACLVGAVRWHGFKIDTDKVITLRDKVLRKIDNNFNSFAYCRRYLEEVLSPMERTVLTRRGKLTTGKVVLEEISKWKEAVVCDKCHGLGMSQDAVKCDCVHGLKNTEKDHPAAVRAKEILASRRATKEIELYNKLLLAGRFHASFKVIGTLSGRMSGTDDLNAHGIKRTKDVRSAFPLADDGYVLTGGDAVSFEVSLMDAVYKDPKLHEELLSVMDCECVIKHGQAKETCPDCLGKGKSRAKIHAIFGTYVYPGETYEMIIKSKNLPGEQDHYTISKNSLFSMGYGGNEFTLETKYNIPKEAAEFAFKKWSEDHPVWAAERKKYTDMFCSMQQPGGIGTKVIWKDPADYIETALGFKRYFTLQNNICKILFELANNPPKNWKQYPGKVVRREREQTILGATQTALYAAAFAIQAANMRAAGNHVIQSYGSSLIKMLQSKLWELQPVGVHDFNLLLMNVHDELMVPCRPELVTKVREIVRDFINTWRVNVPLLDFDWHDSMNSWADK